MWVGSEIGYVECDVVDFVRRVYLPGMYGVFVVFSIDNDSSFFPRYVCFSKKDTFLTVRGTLCVTLCVFRQYEFSHRVGFSNSDSLKIF